jgi:hypothetical protein
MYKKLTIKVMVRQLGPEKPFSFLDRVLSLGWIWLRAQSLGWMISLSPREGELNQLLLNLSMSGGLAGGAGAQGRSGLPSLKAGKELTQASHYWWSYHSDSKYRYR